jgi:hypothetical protein
MRHLYPDDPSSRDLSERLEVGISASKVRRLVDILVDRDRLGSKSTDLVDENLASVGTVLDE